MERLAGIIFILLGTAAGLWEWRQKKLETQSHLKEWIAFLRRAGYAMEEKQRMTRLFECYVSKDPLLTETLSSAAKYLGENRFASGEEAWLKALEENGWSKILPGEELRLIASLGGAFFGRSRIELRELMDTVRVQLEECLKKEETQFAKNQRTVMPVGMLGSLLLILLLI